MIEIPNGQKMYQEQCYYDIFTDHVNYFTPLSLCMLAKQTGFEVISISEEFNRNHMSMFVRKPFHELRSFSDVINADKKTINDIIETYNNVSVWGAGGKARAFIDLIEDKSKLSHYWDINSLTWNQYLDSAVNPITKPNSKEINESDLILIFAAAYTEEIIHDLKETYNYRGDVVRFDGEIRLEHII